MNVGLVKRERGTVEIGAFGAGPAPVDHQAFLRVAFLFALDGASLSIYAIPTRAARTIASTVWATEKWWRRGCVPCVRPTQCGSSVPAERAHGAPVRVRVEQARRFLVVERDRLVGAKPLTSVQSMPLIDRIVPFREFCLRQVLPVRSGYDPA